MSGKRKVGGVGGSARLAQVGQSLDEEGAEAYRVEERFAPDDSSRGEFGPTNEERDRSAILFDREGSWQTHVEP